MKRVRTQFIRGALVLMTTGFLSTARAGDGQTVSPGVAQAETNNGKPQPQEMAFGGGGSGPGVAQWLQEMYPDKESMPEAARMFISIAGGSNMGPGEGWFGPAASRYGWSWLCKRCGVADDQEVDLEHFSGPKEWFAALDRNRDGKVSAADMDWSDQYAQQAYAVNRLFRQMEPTGNGRLSKQDWDAFFDRVAGSKTYITSEDLAGVLAGSTGGNLGPGDRPTTTQLVRGLFSGEIGSLQEGPALNAAAPDFTLRALDGNKPVHLADHFGKKPVVLVFGNFTCGPFRSMYSGVEQVAERLRNEATFLAVYVREAHPTDGWRMAANDKVQVAVAQPTEFSQRYEVAAQCQKRLDMKIPLVVDEIDDRVGNAYSGMPARLYVIDTEGKIAYKGGRGPFGFKVGEMEQSLIMCLLEQRGTGSPARLTPPPLPAVSPPK